MFCPKPNTEKAIRHANFKYDPSLSSHTEKVLHTSSTNETVILHTGTNVGSFKWTNTFKYSLGGSITDHLARSNHDIKATSFIRGSVYIINFEKD